MLVLLHTHAPMVALTCRLSSRHILPPIPTPLGGSEERKRMQADYNTMKKGVGEVIRFLLELKFDTLIIDTLMIDDCLFATLTH